MAGELDGLGVVRRQIAIGTEPTMEFPAVKSPVSDGAPIAERDVDRVGGLLEGLIERARRDGRPIESFVMTGPGLNGGKLAIMAAEEPRRESFLTWVPEMLANMISAVVGVESPPEKGELPEWEAVMVMRDRRGYQVGPFHVRLEDGPALADCLEPVALAHASSAEETEKLAAFLNEMRTGDGTRAARELIGLDDVAARPVAGDASQPGSLFQTLLRGR